MDEWANIRTEASYELIGRRPVPSERWPLAGMRLEPLKEAFGLKGQEDPKRLKIINTDQVYLVTNGYLIPYYRIGQKHEDVGNLPNLDLSGRNEALIVARANGFINNTQPELGVLRTKEQINKQIGIFEQMPEKTLEQCARKAAQFKIIVGSVMKRLETLGRVIMQGNTEGTTLEYDEMKKGKISDKGIEMLRKEYKGFYQLLANPNMLPLMHMLLLTDKKVDADGILIDLLREIGKPVLVSQQADESYVRDNILHKIGYAIQSIDQVHHELHTLLTTEPTKALFEKSLENFVRERGYAYRIHNVADVVGTIDRYAALCRARTGIRGDDDTAYDEIFCQKDALNELFNSKNGLLESMRAMGRGTSTVEIQKLRDIISRSLKLMDRTSYTRTPCNERAPEPWIPNLSADATPMERYFVDQILSPKDQERAQRVFDEASKLNSERERTHLLRKSFCSLGMLRADVSEFKAEMMNKGWQGFVRTARSMWSEKDPARPPVANQGRTV